MIEFSLGAIMAFLIVECFPTSPHTKGQIWITILCLLVNIICLIWSKK